MNFDRRHVLFGLTLCSTLFVLFLVWPKTYPPNVKGTLIKQNGSIKDIDTPRNPSLTKTFYFDVIEFQNSNALVHKNLGPLGYSNDFFIDFEAKITVLEEGFYDFTISSDDGFRLWIDEQKIAEFLTDRPVASTKGSIQLTKGPHIFRLSYFQGYGNLGLKATYSKGASGSYLVGESSDLIEFEPYRPD